MNVSKYCVLSVCAAWTFVFCAFSHSAFADDWREAMWERPVALRDGVTLRAYALEKPRMMKAYVARIDLSTPGISFTATERAVNWGEMMPDYTDAPKVIDTKRESTADFMRRRRNAGMNVEIAVNTSGWAPWVRPFTHEYASFRSWVVSDGVEISHGKNPENGVYFIIRKDGRAQIRKGVNHTETNDVAFAMYGMGLVLTNNVSAFPEDLPKYTKTEPRMAMGLTPDGKTLVLLAVDGRQKGYSLGAAYADLADIMRREGVSDAINVDGGGSSSLVVFDHKGNAPLMLNRHGGRKVRKVATNLGIVFDDSALQSRRELERSGANYYSYEFLPVEDTPPPEGFRPFYISHYGRHGSRRMTTAVSDKMLKILEKADNGNGLTSEGRKLLAAVRRLSESQCGMVGELTERGAEEHRRLARRMAERFPSVFSGGRRVRCRSTTVPRVLLSMQNFTASLKNSSPSLEFDFSTGDRYFHLLCEPHFAKENEGLVPKINAAVNAIASREINPDGLVKRVFSSPELVKDKVAFVRDLFKCASNCQCVREETGGVDLYQFFKPDEISANARVLAAGMYAFMANNVEFGESFMRASAPLALDLVSRAENAISDDRVAADLRFGHDNGIWPLAAFIGLDGPDVRVPIADAWKDCPVWKWSPMAANLQLVFYRNGKGDVLVKFLYNEREMSVRGLKSVEGPYYSWPDAKKFIMGKVK